MIDDIFYKNLDYIDLHGFDMETARVMTNDFIEESIILNREKVIIIHGIGMGKVKKSVHNALKNNKFVKTFMLCNSNEGMTVVELLLDKH